MNVILNWIKDYYEPLLPIRDTMKWSDIEWVDFHFSHHHEDIKPIEYKQTKLEL